MTPVLAKYAPQVALYAAGYVGASVADRGGLFNIIKKPKKRFKKRKTRRRR